MCPALPDGGWKLDDSALEFVPEPDPDDDQEEDDLEDDEDPDEDD